jgi:outer membrane protein assembly factor BamB
VTIVRTLPMCEDREAVRLLGVAIVTVALLGACARKPDYKLAGAAGNAGGSGPGSAGGGDASGSGGTAVVPGPGSGVLQYHNHANRDGVYVDAALTRAAAATLHIDPTFASPSLSGTTWAQALYLDGVGGKPDLVFAATMENHVYALDAATGAEVWHRQVGPPAIPMLGQCDQAGIGIRGTPIIDGGRRIIYLDAVVGTSFDGGGANKHLVFALDADTGETRPGWPVDVDATARSGGLAFDSSLQKQHGGLALLGGTLYLPYGGVGDCGNYHGWVVGISTDDPRRVSAWATRALGGGVWAPAGVVTDGQSLYVATGNTFGTATWLDGEAVIKLPPSLVATNQPGDYYAPTNWYDLDRADADLGGTAPVLVDVPGATPSRLVVALGKDQKAYLLDRDNLGGVADPLVGAMVGGEGIITAAATYPTALGVFVAFRGFGICPAYLAAGHLSAFLITATAPPTIKMTWCGGPKSVNAPAVSMIDADGTDAIVWMVGTDAKLHGHDGETGVEIFGGGPDANAMPGIQKLHTPIVAHGRIFLVGDRVYALTPGSG